MVDFEIQEIRRIRHQVSSEHGNDLRALGEYYHQIENELKKTGKYRFIEKEHDSKEKQTETLQ